MLEKLTQVAEPLTAQVYSCEDFERENGRFEIIYGIDLIFDGHESVTNFLVEDLLAVKVSLFVNYACHI